MICVDISKFDQQRFYLLTHKIKNVKSQFDNKLNESSCKCLKGRRYQDDERIARMIVGDIYGECEYDLEAANKKFLSLNSTEMMPYIEKSVVESAVIDYHYEYEKDWG